MVVTTVTCVEPFGTSGSAWVHEIVMVPVHVHPAPPPETSSRPSGRSSVTVNGPGSAPEPVFWTVICQVAVRPVDVRRAACRGARRHSVSVPTVAFPVAWIVPPPSKPVMVAVLSTCPVAMSAAVTV